MHPLLFRAATGGLFLCRRAGRASSCVRGTLPYVTCPSAAPLVEVWRGREGWEAVAMSEKVDPDEMPQSAEALRMSILTKEMEKMDAERKGREAEQRKLTAFTDDFLHKHVSEDEIAMVRRLVGNAVKDGKMEAMVYSFPSDPLAIHELNQVLQQGHTPYVLLEQGSMDRGRQRTAVRGARLVVARFGTSDSGATSSGTRWCSISTSACLMTCAPCDARRARAAGRRRPAARRHVARSAGARVRRSRRTARTRRSSAS